jgi:enamine deaminase RidA (YjgF/YER057c/UK114 family)
VIRPSLLVLAACCVALVAAGCGSKPKPVTKAQYEQHLQHLGDDLVNAGSQIGQHLDISSFNEDIGNFQDHLRDASKELKGMKPPPNARGPNKRLADAFHDLADALDRVKDARRNSLREASKAFGIARDSAPAKQGRAAVKQLQRRGYAVGQMSSL